jgi:hypothetical protein
MNASTRTLLIAGPAGPIDVALDLPAGPIRGIGLVAPMLTGILPWLTPIAAGGLVLTMLGAMATHLRRGENQMIVVNLALLLLAAFVAYGRFVG